MYSGSSTLQRTEKAGLPSKPDHACSRGKYDRDCQAIRKNGFIIRKSYPNDERVTILKITQKGKTTLNNIEKERDEHTHAMLKGFPEDEKIRLLNTIKRLIKNSRKIR